MAVLNGYSVKNIRGLRCVEGINLKPINVLVGKNSSGKSTYARILPLLKQTLSTKPRDPLLWWGGYVDFGSFDSAVGAYREPCGDGSKIVESFIEIGMKLSYEDEEKNGMECEIKFKVKKKNSKDDLTYVSDFLLECEGDHYRVTIDQDTRVQEITINDQVIYNQDRYPGFMILNDSHSIIPDLVAYDTKRNNKADGTGLLNLIMPEEIPEEDAFHVSLFVQFSGSDQFLQGPRKLIGMMKSKDNVFKKHFKKSNEKDLLFLLLPGLLNKIARSINSIMENTSYIEPLRAIASRYYRKQNLSAWEIDGKGENIAMFFSSITYEKLKEFNVWLSKHFGFKVDVTNSYGHVSINIIIDESGEKKNIADVGFGYSQILPILVQLWINANDYGGLARKKNKKRGKVVVIEQPELHLHPAYQSKIADILASCATSLEDSSPLTMIIETHSPQIVNRLGSMVANKKLNPDDVQILVFDNDRETHESRVSVAKYDERGALKNWPYGFFEPEV